VWRDFRFADRRGNPSDALVGRLETTTLRTKKDRQWRRGYYTKPQWDKKVPEKEEKPNKNIRRHADMMQWDEEDVDDSTDLDRRLPKYMKQLHADRSRQQRSRSFIGQKRKPDSPSSSSSSSSSSGSEHEALA
jgi:hypothetical protein